MRYQFNAIQWSCQMIRRKAILQMARVNSKPVGTFVVKSRKPGWNFHKNVLKFKKRNEAAWNYRPVRRRTMSEEKRGIADAENGGTTETMADYARELEASFRTIREGDVISGTVIDVRETGVTLDLGYYAPAVIKTEDLSRNPSFSVLADIHVGDTLEGTVVKRDDGAGNIQMSCVEAAETLGWDRLKQYQEEKTILKIKVSESVNQGVTAYVEGIRGFIPASQLALDYVEDTTGFVGKTLEVRVITVDSDRQKLVLSAKDVLKEKEVERLNHKISMIVPGTVVEGRVESLMPYGAFVDLGDGLSGLVHISQISQKRLKKPSEVLTVGDTVRAVVLNTKDNRISLSIKAAAESAEPDELEEKQAEEYSSNEAVGTSLGDLLKGLKL